MIIQRWLLKRFGLNLLLSVFALASLLSIFDLLANANSVTKNAEGVLLPLFFYLLLRVPSILVFVFPFAVLISSLQSFSSLANRQEIVALQTAGCSLLRIATIFVTGAICAAIMQFFFTNYIVTASVARLAEWKATEYKGLPQTKLFPEKPKWLGSENYIVNVDDISPDGTVLDSTTMIWRDDNGVMSRYIKADTAQYTNDQWMMTKATERNFITWKVTEHETLLVDFELMPHQLAFLNREINVLRFSELQILGSGRVKTQIHSPQFYLIAAWQRIAQPLGAAIMVLIAAPVAMQLNRKGNRILFSAIAMAMGFLYFVAERICLTLCEKGDLPLGLGIGGAHILFGIIGLISILKLQK